MENTVIGVYDSYAQAQNAMNELASCGFSRNDMQLNPESDTTTTAAGSDTGDTGGGIGNFFRSLFGMDDKSEYREHGDIYSEAVRRGSCVLTVYADSDEERERAIDVMNRYDPVDIDERSTQWRSQGWTGYDESAPMYSADEIERERGLYAQGRTDTGMDLSGQSAGTSATQNLQQGEGKTRIPVVEEELRVGKREVQRGGVRVFQRIREQPVNESVQLREEHVKVERHAVDKPASEADMAAFKEGSIELRETAEEAIVSKSARVVEEVEVSKEVGQRTEEIKDTVRRTDVEVEQLGAAGNAARTTAGTTTGTTAGSTASATRGTDYADTMATGDDSDYRTHWQSAYGSAGGRYEDYDSAYRYGSTMAGSDRFKNYEWTDVEPQLRSDWEANHPESTWDKVKDAVRYGAERVSGRSQRH
ncbi:hypothetical protein GCM10027343_15140 [Noviherbaspirillum agri]